MRDLNKIAKECEHELELIGVKFNPNVQYIINSRAHHRWGLCTNEIKPNGVKQTVIQINSVLLDTTTDIKGLKNTIIHELLHSVDGCHGHTGKWKRVADYVNSELGYNIKRTNSADEKGVDKSKQSYYTKYVITCNQCGLKIPREKKSKVIQHPELYHCGKCGGTLSVSQASI